MTLLMRNIAYVTNLTESLLSEVLHLFGTVYPSNILVYNCLHGFTMLKT